MSNRGFVYEWGGSTTEAPWDWARVGVGVGVGVGVAALSQLSFVAMSWILSSWTHSVQKVVLEYRKGILEVDVGTYTIVFPCICEIGYDISVMSCHFIDESISLSDEWLASPRLQNTWLPVVRRLRSATKGEHFLSAGVWSFGAGILPTKWSVPDRVEARDRDIVKVLFVRCSRFAVRRPYATFTGRSNATFANDRYIPNHVWDSHQIPGSQVAKCQGQVDPDPMIEKPDEPGVGLRPYGENAEARPRVPLSPPGKGE
ncbi:hypothetical protein V8F06_006442 [Rhypophila decipiens]